MDGNGELSTVGMYYLPTTYLACETKRKTCPKRASVAQTTSNRSLHRRPMRGRDIIAKFSSSGSDFSAFL